jgi:SlyX protein
MDHTERTDQRLTDLEIKASYAEDLLDDLNQIIARQQQHLDFLSQELALLRQQQTDPSTLGFRSLRDDLPPHY